MENIAEFAITDFAEGQSFSFEASLTDKMIDDFAALTGDISSLHMDLDFAQQRGFNHRVVHGQLLGGLASRLVGVHLPGKNCLLHSISMKFLAPVYANETVRVTGTVEQVSIATKAMTVQISILNTLSNSVVAKGKATLGFTEVKASEQH